MTERKAHNQVNSLGQFKAALLVPRRSALNCR